jgi:hypothetical protein
MQWGALEGWNTNIDRESLSLAWRVLTKEGAQEFFETSAPKAKTMMDDTAEERMRMRRVQAACQRQMNLDLGDSQQHVVVRS